MNHKGDNGLSSTDKKCIQEGKNRSAIQHEPPHDVAVIPGVINGSAPITQTNKSRRSDKMAALALGVGI